MSSYPPSKWKVRYLKDMQTLACESTEEDAISMAAYLAVRPSDGEEGSFRFVLHGPDNIKLKFPANRLLPGELFADMFIEAELKIGDQIQMERNSVCSAWVDIVDLVRSQDILVVDSSDEDVAVEFLAAIDAFKRDHTESTGKADSAGICLRWVLGTRGEDTRIILFAQVIIIADGYKT